MIEHLQLLFSQAYPRMRRKRQALTSSSTDNVVPEPVVAILLLFSSQLLGYGMAGVLRKSLVYPTRMLWPSILPLSSLIETLHRERTEMKKRFNFFWIIFGIVAVWELFPQYIMPILVGVSVICLTQRNSLVVSNIFGGAAGNEGLGLLVRNSSTPLLLAQGMVTD